MKGLWKRWSAGFAARQRREKWIIGIAALAVTVMVVDALALTPALNQWKAERKALAQRQADLAALSAQAAQLTTQLSANDAQNRAALAAGRRELTQLSAQLTNFEKTLVPARRMTHFLQGLLPGRGLEVVAVKTLPAAPLIARPSPKAVDGPAASPAPVGDSATPAANLYKHGVEITLAGSYPALLDYLDRLEKSPQKLMFGRLELRADKYPRSELTLIVYTLSLDRSWLIV